ncbi:MAG: hypothetical protein Q7S12_04405 [bacterium]|nr:hypothetical protein [bacterium]
MPKETTNDELARMIAKGFEETASKVDLMAVKTDINSLKSSIQHIDGRLDHLDARMGRMEADLDELKGGIVYKFEFEDLMSRVKYLETKLGVESGK